MQGRPALSVKVRSGVVEPFAAMWRIHDTAEFRAVLRQRHRAGIANVASRDKRGRRCALTNVKLMNAMVTYAAILWPFNVSSRCIQATCLLTAISRQRNRRIWFCQLHRKVLPLRSTPIFPSYFEIQCTRIPLGSNRRSCP